MDSPLKKRSFEFALRILSIAQQLEHKKSFVIAKQILKSGTSVGANIREAMEGQSRADFIAKLSIALKEAVETEYWLELIRDGKILEVSADTVQHIKEIIRMLTASIRTAKSKY